MYSTLQVKHFLLCLKFIAGMYNVIFFLEVIADIFHHCLVNTIFQKQSKHPLFLISLSLTENYRNNFLNEHKHSYF